jgi:hypothetical protein
MESYKKEHGTIARNSGKLWNITPNISINLPLKVFTLRGAQCPTVIFLIFSLSV